MRFVKTFPLVLFPFELLAALLLAALELGFELFAAADAEEPLLLPLAAPPPLPLP